MPEKLASMTATRLATVLRERFSKFFKNTIPLQVLVDTLQSLFVMSPRNPSAPRPKHSFHGADEVKRMLEAEEEGEANDDYSPPAGASSQVLERIREQTAKHGDLQAAEPDVLRHAKAEMELGFQANRVKPGDREYQYDVRVEFDEGEEPNDWDEDGSDDEPDQATQAAAPALAPAPSPAPVPSPAPAPTPSQAPTPAATPAGFEIEEGDLHQGGVDEASGAGGGGDDDDFVDDDALDGDGDEDDFADLDGADVDDFF